MNTGNLKQDVFTGQWNATVTMPRTPVTPVELVEVLNTRLSTVKGLRNVRVEEVVRLKGVDETGCNWSENVRCTGVTEDFHREEAQQLIENTRSRYNLI